MVLLFWPTPWLGHDSWHIQDWFEVFKERKNYKSFVFSFSSSSWSARRLLGYLFGSKQKSAFFFSIFGATQSASLFFKWVTFLHLIFGVSCGLFLEIWFTFVRYFSSCNLHLGVFVRLMPFGHFVNSFGDSGRN